MMSGVVLGLVLFTSVALDVTCARQPHGHGVGEKTAVELRTPDAACRISLRGARVLSFVSHGEEVLWNDDPVQVSDAEWAHGGIPFCWPWFCENAEGRIHGQTWRDDFRLVSKDVTPSNAVARFAYALGDGAVDYRIELTDVLSLSATVRNAGTNALCFTGGFHPYFRVGERDRTTVVGLDGLAFEDDPSFANPQTGVWHGDIRVTNVIDRLFALNPPTLQPSNPLSSQTLLLDPSLGRDMEITSSGLAGVGVWNPGTIKNYPGKLPEDGWRRFVCVEPVCRGPSQEVRLLPGESHTWKMSVAVRKRSR